MCVCMPKYKSIQTSVYDYNSLQTDVYFVKKCQKNGLNVILS